MSEARPFAPSGILAAEPRSKGHQVGHILRAAANVVRIAEIEEGDASAAEAFERALSRASPTLINVLSRYPLAPKGKSRAAQLMTELEAALRATRSLVLRIFFDSALVGDAVLLALRPHGPIVSASPA